MKYRITLLYILFLTLFNAAFAQKKEVTYKFGYTPNSVYEMEITQINTNNVEYLGPEKFLEKLKQNGIEKTLITIDSSFTKSLLTTGEMIENKVSVTMEFLEEANSEEKRLSMIGSKIYGIAYKDSMPIMDSISSKDMPEFIKQTILEAMNSTFSQMNVNERQISVGSVFTEEQKINIPIQDLSIEMDLVSTYTVQSITDNKAYIDMITEYEMVLNLGKINSTDAKGSGKGKIIYDILNTFYVSSVSEQIIEVVYRTDDFWYKVTTNNFYKQENNIINN